MTPHQTIAHYRITGKLGEGGMGAVYRATDTKLNRDVAIKVIPDSFAQDPDRMARFEREAQVLASLNHPNIAAIHGVEERAIVMELVEGETLSGPMSIEDALPVIHQLIDGLEYAHEKGIVHRDLKPANIKVTPEGRVKILDFGLAKAMSADAPAGDPASSPTLTMRATMTGMIMGTAAYMAPEQARGHNVDKRADIWSFGVVVYELVTGRRLFEGASISDTLASVLKVTPDWEGVPPKLRKLLRLCLEKDPRRRLRDIGDARVLIEDEAPAPAVPAARSRLPWAAATVLGVALAATGTVLWKASRPVDRPLIRLSVDLGPEAQTDTVSTAVLSPDGTRLVHLVRPAGGVPRIATRLLGQREATVVTGTENATAFFLSPDGEWIGFFSLDQLKKVPAAGGGVVTLCEAPTARGADWGEDDSIIASIGRRLVRVPSTGGKPEALTDTPEDNANQRTPQILPGGQSVLYTAARAATGYENARIEVFSLKTRQTKVVARGYYGRYVPSGHLLFIREGALVAQSFDPVSLETRGTPVPILEDVAANPMTGMGQFTFSNNGTLAYFTGGAITPGWELAWMDRSGKAQPLPIPRSTNASPRLSPDGRLIMISAGGLDSADLWLYNFDRNNLSRFTFDHKGNSYPVWAPDGKHVVYLSLDKDVHTFWWARADGAGEPQRLIERKEQNFPTSISPAGRLAFRQQAATETRVDLWTLPIDMTDAEHPKPGQPEPFLRSPAIETAAAFSPDGKWIAHSATDTGKLEVYVRPFPGPGGRWLISNGGGDHPVWSRDGRTLVYRTAEGRIMELDYQVKGDSFLPGKPRPWADALIPNTSGLGGRSYDLSPDGKRLLVPYQPAAADERKGSVHVAFLLNFFDELRRRVP